MSNPAIGICTLEFYLPGVASLKEKRSIIKPLQSRLRKTFNVSVAEVDYNDKWQSAKIAIAVVSNTRKHSHQMLHNVVEWIETNFPDAMIVDQDIELI